MKRWLIYLGVVGLLIAGRMPPAVAHEGHGHKVLGTVATIQGSHLEVTDKDGKTTMHMLDAKTKIRRGRAVATLANIKVGDRVGNRCYGRLRPLCCCC